MGIYEHQRALLALYREILTERQGSPPHARGKARIDYPVNVKCVFYMPTRRRVDLTNLLEAVDDVLVRSGVLADDHSGIVVSHDGSRVLYDKENPRTEVEITGWEAGRG